MSMHISIGGSSYQVPDVDSAEWAAQNQFKPVRLGYQHGFTYGALGDPTISLPPSVAPCECGAESAGCGGHSHWCPKHEVTK